MPRWTNALSATRRATHLHLTRSNSWRSTMPEKERADVKQEERRKPTATELKLMALKAENEQLKRNAAAFKREVREYRAGLETAIGKIIANQRNELAEALKQIDCLRTELDLLRSTLPVRLVQPTIGRAAGA